MGTSWDMQWKRTFPLASRLPLLLSIRGAYHTRPHRRAPADQALWTASSSPALDMSTARGWRSSTRYRREAPMGSEVHDKFGRPLVAITGCGLVTSLGQGKEASWSGLTQGRSGIRQIARFPIDGLRTTIAGSVDFFKLSPYSAPALTVTMSAAAGEEAVAEADIARIGNFPGPL